MPARVSRWCERSEEPRQPDSEGNGGNQCADCRDPGRDHGTSAGDRGDHADDRRTQPHRVIDRRGGRATGVGNARDRPQRARGGERHAGSERPHHRRQPRRRKPGQRPHRCSRQQARCRSRPITYAPRSGVSSARQRRPEPAPRNPPPTCGRQSFLAAPWPCSGFPHSLAVMPGHARGNDRMRLDSPNDPQQPCRPRAPSAGDA